jgi:hypothetical protein
MITLDTFQSLTGNGAAPLKAPRQNIRETHLHPPGRGARKNERGEKEEKEFI